MLQKQLQVEAKCKSSSFICYFLINFNIPVPRAGGSTPSRRVFFIAKITISLRNAAFTFNTAYDKIHVNLKN